MGEVVINLEEDSLLAHRASVDLVAEAIATVVVPLPEFPESCKNVNLMFLKYGSLPNPIRRRSSSPGTFPNENIRSKNRRIDIVAS